VAYQQEVVAVCFGAWYAVQPLPSMNNWFRRGFAETMG
jgi:hypothetical protein